MTRNQIEYWSLQEQRSANSETARSNRAREIENNRHNVATETIDLGKLQETSAHNRATETQAASELKETTRAHKENERQGVVKIKQSSRQMKETERANKASESIRKEANAIESAKLEETIRNNQATVNARLAELEEAKRTHRANESISAKDAETRRRSQIADQAYKEEMAVVASIEAYAKEHANTLELKKILRDTKKWKAQLEETKRKNDLDATVDAIRAIQNQEEITIDLINSLSRQLNTGRSVLNGTTQKQQTSGNSGPKNSRDSSWK